MTEKEAKTELAGGYLGAILFVLGLIPLVLVATALAKSGNEVVGEPTAMAKLAYALVRALGYVPSLLLYGSMAALGGALFLGFPVHRPGRHLLGMVGFTLGAAIIGGALAAQGGGVVGDLIGGNLGAVLGILLGAAVVTGTVVVAYLDGKIPMPKKLGSGATLSTALTELDDAGVSNAESGALAADASTLAYMEALWKAPAEKIQVHPMPPSPYPEDVRLKGEVPDGATPLPKQAATAVPTDVPKESPADSESVDGAIDSSEVDAHRWERSKAKSSEELAADSDLGASDLKNADPACEADPFREESPVEAYAQAESADFVLPVPDLPPGVKPLEKSPSGSWHETEQPEGSSSAFWEREKAQPEAEELEILMDLPESTGTLPKLNFESLQFGEEQGNLASAGEPAPPPAK
ncbi:MAG: hypothetical protein KDB61_08875, partial [Planctomycetes bacterium]|nr:hypothetical protein [Planctomycetota bacterium]